MDQWHKVVIGDLLVSYQEPSDRTGWTYDKNDKVWWKIYDGRMAKPNVDTLIVKEKFVSEALRNKAAARVEERSS